MIENRESLLWVVGGIQGIAVVSMVVVVIWCYFKYVQTARIYSASGDPEGWIRFVRRTSARTGLVVLVLSLVGAEATMLGVLLSLELPLTPATLSLGAMSGIVMSLFLTILFLRAARWQVLEHAQRARQSTFRKAGSTSGETDVRAM